MRSDYVDSKSTGQGPKSKYWCVTDNNPDLKKWESLIDHADLHYGVWQLEQGEEKKRPHIQAYLEFKKLVYMTGVKKLVGNNRIHCEKRRARNGKDAADYCKKDDTLYLDENNQFYRREFGVLQLGKGVMSEEALAIQAVKDGKSMEEIAKLYSQAFVRRGRGLWALKTALLDERKSFEPVQGLYIYGPTRSGKTWFAVKYAQRLVAEGKYKSYFLQQPKGPWWDGYTGEEIVILNEMSGNELHDLPFQVLLSLYDPFSTQVAIKGGFVKFCAKLIIITSNVHIDGFYEGNRYNQGQLKPRMTLGIIKMEQRKDIVLEPKEFNGADEFMESQKMNL